MNSSSIPIQPTLESLELEYGNKHEEYEAKKKEMIGEMVACMGTLKHIDPVHTAALRAEEQAVRVGRHLPEASKRPEQNAHTTGKGGYI